MQFQEQVKEGKKDWIQVDLSMHSEDVEEKVRKTADSK